MLLQKWDEKSRVERTLSLLHEVGLEDKTDRRPSELSGGQQQRVAIARALATRPKYILADEPTANLDSVSAGKLLDLMAELNQNEKMTFIFSTHDQRVIERARRVITLEDGKIVSDQIQDTLRTH
jgi:putative ABC transport system ATP-binding protein